MVEKNEKLYIDSLIQGCLKKDRDFQKKLYEHFYSFAMAICVRYAFKEEEGIEIMNDGFMKVFDKLDKYNPELSFHGWLRRIMINTALDHFRKNKKFKHTTDLDSLQESNEEPGTPASVLSRMSFEEIIGYIQLLSPVYRTVFNLHVIDGYSHEEIAERLKISIGTSKSNLSKARMNLRRLLQHAYQEEYAKFTG
jgi:RNA polymerase sigma-70 factor (ECF subfamily)